MLSMTVVLFWVGLRIGDCMKSFIKVAAVLLMLCISHIYAWAESPVTNAQTTMSESAEKFLSRIGIHPWIDDGVARSIQCFDVNSKGYSAIGFCGPSIQTKYVGVYDKAGNFLYGYSFQCSGSYLIEWINEDQLAIYWLRGSVRATFDQNCKCQEYFPYKVDTAMNRHLNTLRKTARLINEDSYVIDKGNGILSQFATGYSRLVRVSANGVEFIVYRASSSSDISGLFVIMLICFITFAVIYSYKRRM